jgi:hypothetical protein
MRRVMMQVVLCAALGLSLALAWWIGRYHAAALSVTLDAPRRFESSTLNLDVRLPTGWKAEIANETRGAMLMVTEPKEKYGAQRTLTIQVRPVGAGITLDQLIPKLAGNRMPEGSPRKVEILGTPGLLLEYPLEHVEASPDGVATVRPPLLIACTIVPGPRPVRVSVLLQGVYTLAPADFDLVRLVAQSLALSDPKHPVSPISKSVEEPDDAPGQAPDPDGQDSPTDSPPHDR